MAEFKRFEQTLSAIITHLNHRILGLEKMEPTYSYRPEELDIELRFLRL